MRWILVVVLALAVCACGTPRTQIYGEHDVDVLYSFPEREHERIGSVSLRYYRPGWSDPTVEQATPRIQQAGRDIGADAVVVVRTLSAGERTIQIHGEGIRFLD